jgi:hypothetical protein
LWEVIQEAGKSSRVSVAVGTDARGVPDLLIGITVPQDEADRIVFAAQRELRLSRDRRIIEAALESRASSFTTRPSDVSGATLVAEKILTSDADGLWSRYRKTGGNITIDPPISPRDFDNAAYVRRDQQVHTLRYIAPPTTENDLRYRSRASPPDESVLEDLKSDKLRLCTVYWNGTLWLGNDADTLGRWLKRGAGLENPDLEEALRRSGKPRGTKAAVFLQPRQLLEQALLHPSKEVNDTGKSFLSALDHYRAVLATVTPTKAKQVQIDVDLIRY